MTCDLLQLQEAGAKLFRLAGAVQGDAQASKRLCLWLLAECGRQPLDCLVVLPEQHLGLRARPWRRARSAFEVLECQFAVVASQGRFTAQPLEQVERALQGVIVLLQGRD